MNAHLSNESVDLIMTSPRFGSVRKKEHGNADAERSVKWFEDLASRQGFLSALLLFAMPCFVHADLSLCAKDIVERAHEAAGGETWVRPRSLYLAGSSTFFDGTSARHYDRHEMWRVYPASKSAAHQADGKVRILSRQAGGVKIDLAFDGQRTYVNGEVSDESENSRRWASNFGFGVIRHALGSEYSLTRLADDQVDGTPSFTIRVTDPAGSKTIFGVAKGSYEILMVGFDTPRGWHQRIYSDFFSKQDIQWNQPGLVRLYYDGIKQNEVRWTDFEINPRIDAAVFQPVPAP